jgi:hypothetical protein
MLILGAIIKNECFPDSFKYLITDGAAHCLRIGKELKNNHQNPKHKVCVCHNLHF